MRIAFRPLGGDWIEYVDWPDGARIPAQGEKIDLHHGFLTVDSVQWYPLGATFKVQVSLR